MKCDPSKSEEDAKFEVIDDVHNPRVSRSIIIYLSQKRVCSLWIYKTITFATGASKVNTNIYLCVLALSTPKRKPILRVIN